jgi:predicted GIY-YIG superfamily endonuclease
MTEETSRPAYVYIVECADGSLYTGWAYNPDDRASRHNAGQGAKYTRGRLPVRLVYQEALPDQTAARKREYALKQLPRLAKLALIKSKETAGVGENSEPV